MDKFFSYLTWPLLILKVVIVFNINWSLHTFIRRVKTWINATEALLFKTTDAELLTCIIQSGKTLMNIFAQKNKQTEETKQRKNVTVWNATSLTGRDSWRETEEKEGQSGMGMWHKNTRANTNVHAHTCRGVICPYQRGIVKEVRVDKFREEEVFQSFLLKVKLCKKKKIKCLMLNFLWHLHGISGQHLNNRWTDLSGNTVNDWICGTMTV